MNTSTRQIIKRILKEETMGEGAITRLLSWYDTWNSKLGNYIAAGDYAKIVEIHFKTGLGLLASIKKFYRAHPEHKEELIEKYEVLRSKLRVINDSRKMIDGLK